MKHGLTTGTCQDDTGCPISIVLAATSDENINPDNGSNAGSQGRQFKKSRNMGAYCSLHGFHPVGNNHDSMTCIYKKPKHKIEATWCNRLGGDMYWPNANRVKVEQQEHPAWKGKVAPTN